MDVNNELVKQLEGFVNACGEHKRFELVTLNGDKFIAMYNKDDDYAFGYIAVNATSMLGATEDIIKACVYGGADRNYISGYTMRERGYKVD